ncbi:putative uncharacterized protein DDB_G0290521 isoform X2 [Mastacembelus armatus]|uniref:putative uncharacterized protein DDB_G0290521 isoform X2 n=1 Tax=Mastacembelus armatus TaxID=205130 RepID=UPI000E460621|nr:putative uncharacterized protein DDB_G0290521 isoform X2 [Mastacembelus armatus]
MMETKLWIALCALLLVKLGSAEHENNNADHDTLPTAKTTAPDLVPPSNLNFTSHPASTLNGLETNSSSGNTSRNTSTPEPKKDNDVSSENNGNRTDESTSKSLVLPSESPVTTSHILPTSTATSPPTTASIAAADTLTHLTPSLTPLSNTSHHPAALPPDSISPSDQPSHTRTHSSTSVPTPEQPKHQSTTAHTTSTQTNSTSSTKVTPVAESPHVSSQSDIPQAQPKSTLTPPSSPSAQAKAHVDTPSQLNVGGDTTMVHESPTLDPLLAGLVSAFIITAVIIALLLFLKLRRRGNQPEFRRLQDLPMDDMMEDTPLSMYSY